MNAEDARCAVLSGLAEEMFLASPGTLMPPPDPRLAAMGYTILGYITAIDELLGIDRSRVYFGFVAACATHCVVVFRGTLRAIEWAEDADATQVPHPAAGRVHAGFWKIYSSARVVAADGADAEITFGVWHMAGDLPIVVTGHSLGAPLATYTAYDLSNMNPGRTTPARLIASPRPGDASFCAAAGAAIRDHVTYAYEQDLVPRVPFGFGYGHLSGLVELPYNARIPDDPLHNHHASTYAWLLDPVTAGPLDYLRPT